MKKKHILVISQYFYPETFRINDISKEWVSRGYKVTVLTGIPNYPIGKFYKGYSFFKGRREEWNGVDIIRIPLIPRGRNPIMLVFNYLSFAISGFIWKVFTKIKADCVFIYEVSPMTQALPGVWYAKKKKIPCYLYVTDLWPENVEFATGIKNEFILGTIGKMVDYIYLRCDRIFTSSESFINEISKRNINKDKLEYWPQYAEDYYKKVIKKSSTVDEIPQDGKFNIIFAGNIGLAQGLDILPQTAKLLRQREVKVRFNIVGDGRYKETLMKEVLKNEVSEYFNFIEKQQAIRIPELMSVCDATLICLAKSKVFSITLPSKTQSCLACGIPILVSADGEIQKIINESKSGLCSGAGDFNELANNIIKLVTFSKDKLEKMSENAIEYYQENFDKTKLLDRMDIWINTNKGEKE